MKRIDIKYTCFYIEKERNKETEAAARDVLSKSVFKNIAKIPRKQLYQNLFFNKVAGLRPKKRFWHRCFPVNFAKSSRSPFFQ